MISPPGIGAAVLPLLVHPPRPAASGHPMWLVTFTDLVGLMLAFFVMIFAMSSVDEHRLREFAGATDLMRQPVPGAVEATVEADKNAPLAEIEHGHDLGYLGALLREQIGREHLLADGIVRQDGGRIVLSLPADLLFAPNGAEPTRQGAQALFALVGMLRNLENRIEVEGHADPAMPDADAFPSNWELSLARAAAVALRLEAAGYGGDVVARGRAATRFDEIAGRLAPDVRAALARRVDVIVHEEAK